MGTAAPPTPPTPQPFVEPGNIVAGQIIPAPAIYVGFNDYLTVSLLSAVATSNLAVVHARIIRRDGTIIQLEEYLSAQFTFQQITTRVALCEGWLIAVNVTCGAVNNPRGALFINVRLARSAGSGWNNVVELAADYCTPQVDVAWPGGQIRDASEGPGWLQTIALGSPPNGSDFSTSPPTHTKWRVLSVGATLTTSSTIANRQVRLTINGIAADLWFVAPGFNATASGTYVMSWLPGCAGLISTPPAFTLPMPYPIVMDSTYSIATSTLNIQSGDFWVNIYVMVEQWMDLHS